MHRPRPLLSVRLTFVWALTLASIAPAVLAADTATNGLYTIPVQRIDGTATNLSQYKGQVMLIVNVASRCGFTPQYAGLQKIYDTYKDRGLVVLGFPANNFGKQEPGSNEEIKQFCETRFHVTFPLFAKISVKGEDQHPLYKYLTGKDTNPVCAGEIAWNFNKFLIAKDGRILARFDSRATPESPAVTKAIEKALEL